MDIDWTARRIQARAYLAERTGKRMASIDEHGKPVKRWVETTHYSYDYTVEDNDMTYWVWQDNDPKKTDEKKRDEACARYMIRFGQWPTNVYTQADQAQCKGTIAPGALWLGPVEDALP